MKALSIHLVLEQVCFEEENPVRAYTKKAKAKESADLRKRTEAGVHGRKGFRVVTVPLFVDTSSPAGSVIARPDMEATE